MGSQGQVLEIRVQQSEQQRDDADEDALIWFRKSNSNVPIQKQIPFQFDIVARSKGCAQYNV